MIICHVITTIERGGAETALFALAKEQVKRGYRVLLVPVKGGLELQEEMIASGIEVNLSLLNTHFLRQIFQLRKLIRLQSLDLLHAHLPRAELLVRLATHQNKDAFLVTRHNSEPFLKANYFGISSFISRWVVKRCRVIVAISKEVERYLRANLEVNQDSITKVIYYGYQRLFSDDNHASRRWQSEGQFKIVTVSRLVPQKNIKLAIDLIQRMNTNRIDVSLTVIGTGPLELDLKEYVQQLGLSGLVHFLGKSDNVFEVFKDKDLFLMTSHYEGFGLAVLEAIDFGLPVCAPNHSAFVEVLGDSNLGLYEPNSVDSLSSKVEQILLDSEFERELKMQQQQRLRQFSIEKYFTAHSEIYRSRSNSGE